MADRISINTDQRGSLPVVVATHRDVEQIREGTIVGLRRRYMEGSINVEVFEDALGCVMSWDWSPEKIEHDWASLCSQWAGLCE